MQSSTCTLCVCNNSFCFLHCILHPQKPPPLLLTLVPHIHSPGLCLTFRHLPYSPCIPSALTSPHLSLLTFSLLSESVGQRDTPAYPAMQQGNRGRLLQLSTVRHGKGKPQQQQEKERLFCASAPSWLLSFPLLHHTGWVGKLCSCKVQAPTRGFLYCFHTKSLCKRDFGCTCTDADQLNDNHEVCTW